ncbi:hypothetical protein ACGFZP_13110 [Kitasatospora sp. NPDC048239]|uniref:hypothetical protein n=1 Tax=Kitasatospora sp. NPDC048239 TaxID=3364046 RepID=UPI003721A09E
MKGNLMDGDGSYLRYLITPQDSAREEAHRLAALIPVVILVILILSGIAYALYV